jgi:D-alanyl-D-alanine dipeptidase
MTSESPFLRDEPRKLREPGISRLDKIPIVECGEPLVDIRQACPHAMVNAPLPWLRETACAMLRVASESLPSGLSLLATTGMRTLDMQAAGYNMYRDSLREAHPEWPPNILNREANKFFHPPHANAPPGHTTGGAVDVRLVSDEGDELDMWSSLLGTDAKTWHTFHPNVTPEVREARMILYDVMVGAGFSNCYDEWWHYSYGDSGWACRLDQSEAIYGRVEEDDYPDEMGEAVAILRKERRLTRLGKNKK